MKILTGAQIAAADEATCLREQIDSLTLMEWAAEQIALWICNNVEQDRRLLFAVGKGNNGGDGLAAARMLHNAGFDCAVYTPFAVEQMSPECRENLLRLPDGLLTEVFAPQPDMIVVDALLGTGLRGAVREPVRSLIEKINASACRVLAIDIPSGLSADSDSETFAVQADTTLTVQYPKLSMMLPPTGECCGRIEVLDVNIDCAPFDTPYHFTTPEMIDGMKRPRRKFAYKNMYGHALLLCGSSGMAGAAVLAAGGALRSGCGLVTVHTPESGRTILQTSCPSAIVSVDCDDVISAIPDDMSKYSAVGAGCGTGCGERTVRAFSRLLEECRVPMVLDADALNILSGNKELLAKVPAGSILTPHIGELRRLAGDWSSPVQMLSAASNLASVTQSVVIVKGAHSAVCLPSGEIFFNSTGDSGMAKGGSGDILTGLVTGLLAAGYDCKSAALIGVFEHGLAGERAAEYYGSESMNSSDIVDFLKL